MIYDIPEIIDRLGYPITIRGKNCVVPSFYREGDNNLALFVNESGICHDQVQNRSFPLVEFVQQVLGGTLKEAQDFIGSSQTAAPQEKEVKLAVEKKFDPKCLEGLTPSYHFYLERGINKKTLQDFEGGLSHGGKLYLRFCFPIYDKQRKVRGASGRCVKYTKEEEKSFDVRPRPKWKTLGEKKGFTYPLFISSPYIQETKQVVLVESIGDCLSLWNAGIKNLFCLFGVALSDAALMALVREGSREIILGLNNDENEAGQKGTEKVIAKLNKMFSSSAIKNAPPMKNDFGDQSIEENREWANKNGVKIFENGQD